MHITTVKELKNFLSNLDDDARVLFSDGCDIVIPLVFEIETMTDYLQTYDEEVRDEVFNDAKRDCEATENDIVINVEF